MKASLLPSLLPFFLGFAVLLRLIAPAAAAYRNEEHWIVESIATDVAHMAAFAASREGAEAVSARVEEGKGVVVSVSLPGRKEPVKVNLTIQGSIWNPTVYAPLAKQLLETLKVEVAEPGEKVSGEPLKLLVTPTVGTIQAENLRLSQWLTQHPLDAEACEQAALVVGVLGLREQAGLFRDARGFCNRATALLAFAEAVRAERPASSSGEVARLLVDLLAQRGRECERQIAVLKQRSEPALKPWLVAADLRNTGDWRWLADPASATLLERIEHFRVLCDSISPTAALRKLGDVEPIPDWGRITYQYDFGVGDGHRFFGNGVDLELSEIQIVAPEIADANLVPMLNREPGSLFVKEEGGARVTVIDPGMWMSYFQRHLCHVMVRSDVFLREKWSFLDRAREFEGQVIGLYAQLRLFPLVQEVWPGLPPDSRTPLADLMRQQPAWIPDGAWAACLKKEAPGEGLPSMETWFGGGFPVGTAYEVSSRISNFPQLKKANAETLEAVYKIAPWNYALGLRVLTARYSAKFTSEQYVEVMSPFLDYHEPAIRKHASLLQSNPKEAGAMLEKAALLEPYNYLRMGGFYASKKMDDEAARAYQAAIDNGVDRVKLANQSKWLVNYYFSRGKKEEAMAVASMAAQTYSYGGLNAMADLQEKMENLSEAEAYFLKISERYDDASPLLFFYQRQVEKDAASPFAARLKVMLDGIFPGGVMEVKLADFNAPPEAAARISKDHPVLQKAGLREGDLLVAINGKQVQSREQFTYLRHQGKPTKLKLIAFKDGKYLEVEAVLTDPENVLNVRTYVKP